MAARDPAAVFVAAARAAFSTLTAEHLSAEQQRIAAGAITAGAAPQIVVDFGSGIVRASLAFANGRKPVELFALAVEPRAAA